MILGKLHKKGLIAPPRILLDNTAYLCRMGSEAYGAALDAGRSDVDVVGFFIPSMDDLFPYRHGGYVFGFGSMPKPIPVWTKHHVKDGDKEYDLTVYSIVKFFHLAMENNINILDCLFVPDRCIMHATELGKMVRDARHLFLTKRAMYKLRGYAFTQMKKVAEKDESANPKRQASIDAHGYDTKGAYHVIRLCLQAEQVLEEHDMTLDRNSQMLLSVRRGEWSLEQLREWFSAKEIALEGLYAKSTLRHSPDEEAIKRLLLQCLEHHYGSLDKAVVKQTDADALRREIQAVLDRHS